MRNIVGLAGLVCLLGLAIGCGEEPVEENNEEEEHIDETALISELEDDEIAPLCDERWDVDSSDRCVAGILESQLIPSDGPGDPSDPVDVCQNVWDDCVDGDELYQLDVPDCELEEMERDGCDATVEEVRDCWDEAGDGFDELTDGFECTDLDDLQSHEEPYTDAAMGGAACQLLEATCEDFLPNHYIP